MRFLLIRVGAASVVLVFAAMLALSPAADAAPTWTAPVVVGPSSNDVGEPVLAVAPDGEAIATWVGGRRNGIQVSTRRPGKGWSPPVTIAAGVTEVEGPRLAVSSRKAVIVWIGEVKALGEGEGARAVLASTRLRGGRWSRPRNISAEKWRYYPPEGEEPQIAMTRGGRATVVWKGRNEKHSTSSFIASATQAARGTEWSAPVGIRGSYEGEAPQVRTGRAGEVVAIWGAYYNEESGIDTSSRPAKGPWEAARRLSTPGLFPQPHLAITSRGEAVAAWAVEPEEGHGTFAEVATRRPGGKWRMKILEPENFGTGPEIVTEPGGRATALWVKTISFEESEVVSSTHVRGAGWSEPTSLAAEGLQLPAPAESLIAVTRGGESIAVWAGDGPRGERTAILSASRRRPQPWSEPRPVYVAPTGRLYGAPDLALALAPDGEAFAVWRCFNGNRWVIEAAERPAATSLSRVPPGP